MAFKVSRGESSDHPTTRRIRLREISRNRHLARDATTVSAMAVTGAPHVRRPSDDVHSPDVPSPAMAVTGRSGSQLRAWMVAVRRTVNHRIALMASLGARFSSTSWSVPSMAPGECLFCRQTDPSANQIAESNRSCFARFDNFPATTGHVEVVPKRHVVSFFELTENEVVDAYRLLKMMQRRLAAEYRPDGFTIGVNEGRAAGRSIDHLHIHLIPRHFGDVQDPRGGIRKVVPNCDPSMWMAGSH